MVTKLSLHRLGREEVVNGGHMFRSASWRATLWGTGCRYARWRPKYKDCCRPSSPLFDCTTGISSYKVPDSPHGQRSA